MQIIIDNLIKLRPYQLKDQQALFKNSYGHLSSDQILDGLNTNSIDKWKQILTHDQVSEFSAIANEMLVEFDYE